MSFITINNIWQEYGDHVVLERLNLQVKEGEFCSMVGASGCGKSTFLRLLLGQEAPSRGEITLDGKPAEMLEKVGLGHALDKYPAQLSGGMQQRLAIAQAFIMQPRVLLLDEPFGALDPGIRKDMHALLLQLWGETRMTVFMVTHDLSEGFNLGTRLLVFDKVRLDPQAPNAYGARITYDIPLNETRLSALSGTTPDNVYALRG